MKKSMAFLDASAVVHEHAQRRTQSLGHVKPHPGLQPFMQGL
jgi:hypothetical protein